jgi:hypothetical protein
MRRQILYLITLVVSVIIILYGDIMATIKEQRLELYRQYLVKSDLTHFIIRYSGAPNAKQLIAVEKKRMWDNFHSKVTEVPKEYTLAKLKYLVN